MRSQIKNEQGLDEDQSMFPSVFAYRLDKRANAYRHYITKLTLNTGN